MDTSTTPSESQSGCFQDVRLTDVSVTEIDRSSVGNMSDIQFMSSVRVTMGAARYKPKVSLKRVGKYWTLEQIDADTAPNSWMFKTRRAAKRFFATPIVVRSPKQMTSLYGTPQKTIWSSGSIEQATSRLDVRRVENCKQ